MNTIDILKKTIKLIETNLESQDLNIIFLSNKNHRKDNSFDT